MANFADRHEQRRVMLATDLVRVGTLAGIAASAAGHVPAAVYALAIVTSIVSTAFRPAEASLIPRLAETPEELTAANVTSSTFDSVGAFAGPAAGALLYTAGGPTLAFLAVSGTYLWSALFVARIPRVERPKAAPHAEAEHGGIAAGFRAVRAEPRLRIVIGLYSVQTMVAGAYSVLVVVVALDVLGLGNAGVGFLQAATGVGAVVGATVALLFVGRRRTAANFGLGLACFGAPLLALAALPRTWAAIVALGLLGIGNSVVDISAVTLIQRTASSAVAGRVFGLVEAAAVGGLGVGSVLTPLQRSCRCSRWSCAARSGRSTRAPWYPRSNSRRSRTCPFSTSCPSSGRRRSQPRSNAPSGRRVRRCSVPAMPVTASTSSPAGASRSTCPRARRSRTRRRSSGRSRCSGTCRGPRPSASSPTRRSGRSTESTSSTRSPGTAGAGPAPTRSSPRAGSRSAHNEMINRQIKAAPAGSTISL
jgi:MFS family permease